MLKLTKFNYLLKKAQASILSTKKINQFLIQSWFPALLLCFQEKDCSYCKTPLKYRFIAEMLIFFVVVISITDKLSCVTVWWMTHISFSGPQFRYKTRVYKQTNLDEKALAKLSTKVFLLMSVEHCFCTVYISPHWHPFPSFPAPHRPVWRSSWIMFRLEQ